MCYIYESNPDKLIYIKKLFMFGEATFYMLRRHLNGFLLIPCCELNNRLWFQPKTTYKKASLGHRNAVTVKAKEVHTEWFYMKSSRWKIS